MNKNVSFLFYFIFLILFRWLIYIWTHFVIFVLIYIFFHESNQILVSGKVIKCVIHN